MAPELVHALLAAAVVAVVVGVVVLYAGLAPLVREVNGLREEMRARDALLASIGEQLVAAVREGGSAR